MSLQGAVEAVVVWKRGGKRGAWVGATRAVGVVLFLTGSFGV
jgi:hypothetical protein